MDDSASPIPPIAGPPQARRQTAVVTNGLSKHYDGLRAVDGVDIELPTGIVSGFVGPNGAGKTTTIQMLLGLIRPTAGTAEVLGKSIAHPAAYLSQGRRADRGAGVLPDAVRCAQPRGADAAGSYRPVPDRRGPGARRAPGPRRSLVKEYSLGMKQRLGVAAALLPAPELAILDEPTNGLDPAGIREMRTILRGLADEGITVFVSSHLLAEIEAICDHLVMIDHGRLVFQGGVAELLDAQHGALIATPEHPGDVPALVSLCVRNGRSARADGESVHVDGGEDWAAELNRQAMAEGITLRGLQETRASLEEAFFAVTAAANDAEKTRSRMSGAFFSEWVKLRRRSMLVWGLGGMVFFSAIATFFTFNRAVKTLQPGFHGHGFRITVAQLSQPNGLVHGIVDVSTLFGVVALALFAGATATEYSQGTLRNLLVREPRRVRLLSGKFLALALFALIA